MPAMSKIFGIGLSKTGTTSLAHAFRILGHSVTEGQVDKIADTDCGTDLYVAAAFKQLDQAYPGSKFVYIQRDMKPWLRSRQRHWWYNALADGWRTLRGRGPSNPEQRAIFKKVYGQAEFDETVFREAYRRHENDIFSYFKDRKQDLLVWNLCNEPDWGKLCEFLQRPIPDEPFPWANAKFGLARHCRNRFVDALKRVSRALC